MSEVIPKTALWVRNHSTAVVAAFLGLALFLVYLNVQSVEKRVINVESSSPCKDLTARQCARKLIQALPPDERKEVVARLRREEARLKARQARVEDLRRRQQGLPPLNRQTPRQEEKGRIREQGRNQPGASTPNQGGGAVSPTSPAPSSSPSTPTAPQTPGSSQPQRNPALKPVSPVIDEVNKLTCKQLNLVCVP